MSSRTAHRLAWALWGLFFPLAGATKYLEAQGGELLGSAAESLSFIVAFGVFATVGALVASRQPRNAVGWILLAVALGTWFTAFASTYAAYGLVVRPGSLPGAGVMAWFQSWTWYPSLGLMVTFLILLFPTGRLPSPRWKPLAWADGIMLASLALPAALTPRIEIGGETEAQRVVVDNPVGIEAARGILETLEGSTGLIFLALVALGVLSLFFRYRRAGREQRQQLKWFLYAAAVLLLGLVIGEVAPDWAGGNFLFAALVSLIPISIAIAVLKYRLYDIDVVINKTLVYGALAGFITAVYVTVVVGLGRAIGAGEDPNLGLSIAATAVVAVAFQPVRERVQRFANRLVYGKRATPYEVLSEFADRLGTAYSVEDVLPRMARMVAEGTGAPRAEVWLRVGEHLRRTASWPSVPDEGRPVPLSDERVPELPDVGRVLPVRHQGELLGALAAVTPKGGGFRPAEEALLQDLASQAGLVLRNVRLTEELRAKIEELRASRQRIVAAQDTERRRLERDIHDGAQQQLVALAMKLRLVETLGPKDPAGAAEMARQAKAEAQDALENLRDLARGIYPPLLADRGLAAALEAHARKVPLPVAIEARGVERYPQQVEAAVYFCVLEALQNVSKYAGASRAVVRLTEQAGRLAFEVEDDGGGFDPAVTPRGAGLQNMADRLEALGGTLEVHSAPGAGTTVAASVLAQPAADQASVSRSGSNSDLGM